MSELAPERLTELRRIAEAATPGPWETTEFAGAEARSEGELGVFAPRHSGSYQKPDGTWHGIVICRGMDGPTKEANAEYIAAFDPPTVLALLAEIERLRRERDVLADAFAELVRIYESEQEVDETGNVQRPDWVRRAMVLVDLTAATRLPRREGNES